MSTTNVETRAIARNNRAVPGKPKPPSERKDVIVQVRLTKAQYRAFVRAARAAGHSLSAWLRALGIRESRQAGGNDKGQHS